MILLVLRLIAERIEDWIFNRICPPEMWSWWEGDPFDKYVGSG